METPTNEQKQAANQLRKELKKATPCVYPNISSIEQFIMQG
jgi:hypothetical protein